MADDGKRKGSGNGFQGLGLSDPVYRGIVRMGFRVSDDGLMSLNPSSLVARRQKKVLNTHLTSAWL